MLESRSPFHDPPYAPRLPLACDKLLIIAQCDQPPLATQRTYLLDLIHIHQRVPVNSPKVRTRQALLQRGQRLRREIFPFAGDYPDDIALGLKSKDLIGI